MSNAIVSTVTTTETLADLQLRNRVANEGLLRLTAFSSVPHLKLHIMQGGKAPSFKAGTEGAALAVVLSTFGIRCTIWS